MLKNYEESTLNFDLTPEVPKGILNLCGEFDQNIKLIEKELNVEIRIRGYRIEIDGKAEFSLNAKNLILELYQLGSVGEISKEKFNFMLRQSLGMPESNTRPIKLIKTRRRKIDVRGANQLTYINNIQEFNINFGIGPAGTGKTYLAVASAVQALESEEVHRIILVRPAVEAGEKLGFLPGDLSQKVDPYLRPMFDVLYELLGYETVARMMERQIIEVAPLAYMRGRTLNESFIILDEAQNTTIAQMKMFLTRVGFNSKVVVTGDITQTDLPNGTTSGLIHAIDILESIKEIGFTIFDSKDVVRHPLVRKIIDAYEMISKKK
ncbi:MAG: PhoH family protein [Gammaproteobacteria bacterium]|jgi:phosphate starvation-inducible PhoH-like protein